MGLNIKNFIAAIGLCTLGATAAHADYIKVDRFPDFLEYMSEEVDTDIKMVMAGKTELMAGVFGSPYLPVCASLKDVAALQNGRDSKCEVMKGFYVLVMSPEMLLHRADTTFGYVPTLFVKKDDAVMRWVPLKNMKLTTGTSIAGVEGLMEDPNSVFKK